MHQLLFILAQAPPAQDDGGGALLFGGGCVLAWVLLAVASLILWIWALIDAIQNPGLSSNERLLWVLVIILTQVLGAILYLLIGRKRGAAT
jgi:Phospholipase_D-nuclease N-terminal